MKKTTLFVLFLLTLWSHAQVRNYTFTQTTGTYSEISGTTLGNESTTNMYFVDPNAPLGSSSTSTGIGLPIGFNFTFNGFTYDRFGVCSNGWISLGSSAATPSALNMTVSSSYTPLSSTSPTPADLSAKIAALAKSLQAQSGASISYQTSGDEGSRVLVVQWKKYRKNSSATDNFNFQIRLNEGTNTVEIVYGQMVSDAAPNATYQVGLRSEPTGTASNFANRKSTNGWTNTAAGTSASDNVLMSNVNFPPNGLKFTWTPPLCGGFKSFTATSITTNGATLNWTSYSPVPESYEYIVSKSATLPLPTDLGTTIASSSVNVGGLEPNTTYNLYARSTCNSQQYGWVLGGTFRTSCLDALTYFDNFENAIVNAIPNCWTAAGTGTVNVNSNSGVPMSAPNNLFMSATGNGTSPTIAYVIMPPVSNLANGKNRLKFRAYSTSTGATLDVGYFTATGNFSVIESVNVPGSSISKAQLFTVTPPALTDVKNLVFRNKGLATGTASIYIDDVVYEPTPDCTDVSAIQIKELADTSVKLSWEKGDIETEWQYAITPAGVVNPNDVTPVTYSGAGTSITVNGLAPSSTYKIWVRSKCDLAKFGSWVASASFTTTCAAAAKMIENFDASSSVLPACWTKISGTVNITAASSFLAPSPANVLNIYSTTANVAVVALPPLSTTASGTYRLRFKAKGNTVANPKLDIGFMGDLSNPDSFSFLTTININSTTVFNDYVVNLGQPAGITPYLAFRGQASNNDSVYLDEVIWEPIPTCDDITALKMTAVTGTKVTVKWTPAAAETNWEYVVGALTVKDPSTLTPVAVSGPFEYGPSATVTGLFPLTSYKIWVRSNCLSSLGAWIGPVVITTSCNSVPGFSENFDLSTNFPSCWTKVGSTGTVSVQSTPSPSSPYSLSMAAAKSTGAAVVAMPPVSNAGSGDYRLRFKAKCTSTTINENLEVGYLINFADPTSFSPLYTFKATQSSTYEDLAVLFNKDDVPTDYLAFRIPGGAGLATFYIDDVIWEPKPTCKDIKNIVVNETTGSTATVSWTKGDNESNWEYVYGDSAITDPKTLSSKGVASNTMIINGLAPLTSYKVWIRSKCADNLLGSWIGPVSFTTACSAVNTFTQNFDASTILPTCWNKIGSGGAGYVVALTDAPSQNNALNLYSPNGSSQAIVSIPPISNMTAANYALKFKYRSAAVGTVLEVGFVSNDLDAASFVPFNTITVDSKTDWKLASVNIPGSQAFGLLAFRNRGDNANMIYIDDVSWGLLPTTAPACAIGVTAKPDASCGNRATVISWPAVDGADGYTLTVGTASGATDILKGKDVLGTSYSVTANFNTKYYYIITPYNSIGSATGCAEASYSTYATGCYCTSVPTTLDGEGITNVKIGATNFANGILRYTDFTFKSVNLARGVKTNLKVSLNTLTYGYYTNVWIDFNNNYNFEPSEMVFNGQAADVNPSVLDASFIMPAQAQLGTHRMRIGASATVQTPENPCYSGSSAVYLDFKINIVAPNSVVNDEAAGATALTVGDVFATNAITGSNLDSTGSIVEATPACGNYNGTDVWYKATIPTTGNLTFEINSVATGLTNTAAAAYSGTSDALTLLTCNDSGSTAGDDHPKIVLTGKTPEDTIYFRVWKNGGDAVGSFMVSAYDSTVLGINDFNMSNFSFYPNPVKDILNISFDQQIDNISVVNLLGQQIISKTIAAYQDKIDMSGLSTGTYLLKVYVGNQLKTIKVIKQ